MPSLVDRTIVTIQRTSAPVLLLEGPENKPRPPPSKNDEPAKKYANDGM